jgi:hypothetical protein
MTSQHRRRHKVSAATSNMPQSFASNDAPFAVQARAKLRKLWQHGDLFHVATRFPRKETAPRIDRLTAILRNGLIAPARSAGEVISDLNLTVLHCEPAYDDFIFLHRYGPMSWLYTISEPGRFAVFVDPQFPVLTVQQMGDAWPELCQDEVYVRGYVPADCFLGVAIHPVEVDSVLAAVQSELERLALPLYDYDGRMLWPEQDSNT